MSTNLNKEKDYIRSATTFDTLQSFRDRVSISERLSPEEKEELLFECDQQRGIIWFDSLPDQPVKVEEPKIIVFPKKKKRSW